MSSSLPNSLPRAASGSSGSLSNSWRISSFNGILLAAYFVPTWTIVALRIMVSPIQGLYERPNISVALFISDYLHLAGMTTVRMAWLLALGKLTVIAFFSVFMIFMTRDSLRKNGDCDEPLAMAIAIASLISFISLVFASRVGETRALQLHATELLLLLGTGIVMLVEHSIQPQTANSTSGTAAAEPAAIRDLSLSGS